jgi:methylmalonyl-CoA/ethylmalonyl-CoA epimerase
MSLHKLDHIGIAVQDLELSIQTFEKLLGSSCYKIEEVPHQGVTTAFFNIGDCKLELISPSTADSSLRRFIKNRGEGLHHLAFEVEEIEKEVLNLENQGFHKIGSEPGLGADQKRIQFIHPENTHKVLIELCQTIR